MLNHMSKIFVDTWGFLEYADKKAPYHNKVASLLKQDFQFFTSTFVINELITILFKRLPFNIASQIINCIFESEEKDFMTIYHPDREILDKAYLMRIKLKDKPNISFTDLVNIEIMKLFQIENIISADKHFAYFNFKLLGT